MGRVTCTSIGRLVREDKRCRLPVRSQLHHWLTGVWACALNRPVSKETLCKESIEEVARDIQYGLEQQPLCALSVTIVTPHFGLLEFRILKLSKYCTSIQLSHAQEASAAFLHRHRSTLSALLSRKMESDVQIDVCSFLIKR